MIQLRGKNWMLDLTRRCNTVLSELEPAIPANHVVRLKSELTNLRRLIVRTDTIRDTSFISSGYLIASSVTGLLCIGLILSNDRTIYRIALLCRGDFLPDDFPAAVDSRSG